MGVRCSTGLAGGGPSLARCALAKVEVLGGDTGVDSRLAYGKVPEVKGTHRSEGGLGRKRATDNIEGEVVHRRSGTLGKLREQDRVDMFEVGSKGEGRRTFLRNIL